MKNIEIAKKLISYFNNHDKKLYLVGGSVRDYLLFNDFSDFDFATPLIPTEIIKLLNIEKYDKFAVQFGTVKFIYEGKSIEITTFRKESNYIDHRHPTSIEFIDDMKIDSNRRDLTINALYMDNEKIYDFHNGLEDLKRHEIIFIGDAQKRIEEDPLRILRAYRFASTLNFKIQENLDTILKSNYSLLSNISEFRINSEINKFNKDFDAISYLKSIKLYDYISSKLIDK